MSAYVIGNYTVHDPEKYAKYPPAVMPTIIQYGGKTLVADHDLETKLLSALPEKAKGAPHQVFVIIEFESVEAAHRWWESPEYRAIKHYREEASEGWGAIVPGFVIPTS